MGDPVGREGVLQRPDHRVLADQVGEGLRPVLARKYLVGGISHQEIFSESSARISLPRRAQSIQRITPVAIAPSARISAITVIRREVWTLTSCSLIRRFVPSGCSSAPPR